MLEIRHLTKVFSKSTVNERTAINDVSISLQTGEFVTIIGTNGAGKSTLFNLIAGTIFPDMGQILLDGTDVTYQPEYRRARYIGHLFQDPLKGTAPSMTIEENLALAYRRGMRRGFSLGISKKDSLFFKEQLSRLELGLEGRMKTRVGLLSGGQRQAITLLMATLVTPKLLLLDEHTAALDPSTAEKVQELTRRIVTEHGITTMMITHNIESALSLGSRTIMMDSGKIVLDLQGEERAHMTVSSLLELFRQRSNKNFDTDRSLLS